MYNKVRLCVYIILLYCAPTRGLDDSRVTTIRVQIFFSPKILSNIINIYDFTTRALYVTNCKYTLAALNESIMVSSSTSARVFWNVEKKRRKRLARNAKRGQTLLQAEGKSTVHKSPSFWRNSNENRWFPFF